MNANFKEYKDSLKLDAGYNRPNKFGQEGVDHLNVWICSNDHLGRFFDPSYKLSTEYPGIGKFRSILTMIYWLKSPDLDDRIRSLTGNKLYLYAKEKNLRQKNLPNYAAIIAYATWLKVIAKKEIVRAIRKLPDDLEILSYKTDPTTGVRIATGHAPIVVPVIKEIIRSVKEGREPRFELFVDTKENIDQFFLSGILKKHLKN